MKKGCAITITPVTNGWLLTPVETDAQEVDDTIFVFTSLKYRGDDLLSFVEEHFTKEAE